MKIDLFNEELEEISEVTDSIIVCGDLNVHHMSWLDILVRIRQEAGSSRMPVLVTDCVRW